MPYRMTPSVRYRAIEVHYYYDYYLNICSNVHFIFFEYIIIHRDYRLLIHICELYYINIW